ncbi:MAG: exodeoxyribonuclease III [Chloroflexi bacterium]|nr:exodeoxyribonuclease III [Chloroflexota bacterium]
MTRYSLLSWNVNGLRSVYRGGFLDQVFERKPDVLCLQETKVNEDQIPGDLKNRPGFLSYFSCAERKGYSGVALFTKQEPASVSNGIGFSEFDREGRIIVADYGRFLLFDVYFPNGGASDERLRYKMDFYDALLYYADERIGEGRNIVICGDVNTAHKEIDLARPKENRMNSGFLPEERAWIDKFLSHGYIDTFRIFNDQPGQYTWWDSKTRARERNVGWRIDAFYVSENLLANVVSACILPEILGSDHCPVGLELVF